MGVMRVGAIFPGQGSQKVGMGVALATENAQAADLFERARAIVGYDLLAVLRDGTDEQLRETRFSQPAIFVVNYALAVAAGDAFAPVASAGHSFAEFCSLTLAGALSFDEALTLVTERGLAMHEAAGCVRGAMAAVLGLDAETLRAVVSRVRDDGGVVQLANFNAPGQIVISGEVGAVGRAGALAQEAGAKRIVALNVAGAWHSALMAPARERFAAALARAPIALPAFTVVSNVDGLAYDTVGWIRKNLERSITDEVLWHRTAERLLEENLDLIVEYGASAVLTPLMKRLPKAPPVLHVGDPAGLAQLHARLVVQ